MKKILLFALLLLAMCFASCEKENIDSKQDFSISLLWDYEYASDEWQGDPIKAFGDSEKSVYVQAQSYNQSALPQFTWNVSCDKDWCHYEYTPLWDAVLELKFTCDDNTTEENRTAAFTINAGEKSLQISVEQLGTPSVTVSTPGTLTQELANNDLLYTTSLKISGELNEKDLETIKGLRDVEILDLTDAVIDDLPDEMFYGNETIKNIRLPRSITTIHPKTFTYSSLEYVYFPANIEKIEDGGLLIGNFIAIGAFSEAPLREVEFENNSNLEYIGDGTFTGCGVKGSYESIGGETIYYSTLNITLPASVEHIGSFAFGDTSWYKDDSGLYAGVKITFEKDSKLKYFGKSLSDDFARGNYAVDCACGFYLDLSNCQKVEYVGMLNAAMVKNDSRASMKIGSTTPPECQGVKVGNDRSSYLYVPKGCVGMYYEADGWKEFDKIEELEQ